MQWSQISTVLEKIVPAAFVLGLLADWFRLRFARHAEERKHIARAISDLLELRFTVLGLCELPKHFPKLVPEEMRKQIPDDLWRCIDLLQFFPVDAELPNRYRVAVEEIAGFRPVLAYRLRGKERYFDLRKFLLQHLSGAPGSPLVASRIVEVLDRECIPALEETLSLLAKSHGYRMRFSISRVLRRRQFEGELIPPTIQNVFHEQISKLPPTSKP